MKLEVLTTRWAADEQVFEGGVHEDVRLTRKLAPLVAGAEAAGVVVVTVSREERKLLARHVESQKDGEKAYDAAQKSGRWRHGQLVQHTASLEDRLAASDDEAEQASLDAQLVDARALLAAAEVPE